MKPLIGKGNVDFEQVCQAWRVFIRAGLTLAFEHFFDGIAIPFLVQAPH